MQFDKQLSDKRGKTTSTQGHINNACQTQFTSIQTILLTYLREDEIHLNMFIAH